ncbi:MAG TPA: DUF2309 domain-containing protein, partial [Nitrospirales bacterium]|nr:DUF2309 domain-containing protein [Nitrospirales bacterium]
LVVHAGTRTIERFEVLLLHLMHGFEPIDPELFRWQSRNTEATSRFRSLWKHTLRTLGLVDPFSAELSGEHTKHSQEPGDRNLHHTLGERVHSLTGIDIVEQINDQMTKWCAAFLDEGLSDWHMPAKDRGFYESWRQLAQRDFSGWFMGIRDFPHKVKHLSSRPEDAIINSLDRLGIQEEQWSEYLTRHIAQLPGWTGLIRWRGENPEYVPQTRYPITLVQYLAVRLFYEFEIVQVVCRREIGCEGTSQALAAQMQHNAQNNIGKDDHHIDRNMALVCRDAWRFVHLAQLLGFSDDHVQSMSLQDARTLLQWLNDFPPERHGPVWLSAYEDHYRRELMRKLSTCRSTGLAHEHRPDAQATFCIDVRSEPFRRILESQGNYETSGYAGFFGAPIHYRALTQEEALPLCPVIISPKNTATEVPRSGQPQSTQRFLLGSRWHDLGHHLFHTLKSHPMTSYMLIDVLGLVFGLAFFGKMIVQKPYRRLVHWLHESMVPHLTTIIPVNKLTNHDALAPYGFTLQEQTRTVEAGLRLTGLTRNFARIVLFCGHGSTTDNNPYAAALDCGACGGSHGGPNARVLAAMANNPQVQSELRSRGIEIPDDTWFVAGEHDTTMDRIELFDRQDIPDTHHQDVRQLETDLEHTGRRVAMERCGRLPNTRKFSHPDAAARHVWGRSGDWSQVRPEWGLSSNAAMIIGKRSLTAGMNLEGRTFLHNYHDDQDETGQLLETIMTAPLVVAEWISFQYYFSAVDPWSYGSGSKVIHNVVGGIGVMLGSQSDLQTGFPLQTVNNGATHFHEPMRLLAIIQAPTERISNIIQRNTVLQQFFDNQWLHLVALDSQTGAFQQYQPGGGWEPLLLECMEAA